MNIFTSELNRHDIKSRKMYWNKFEKALFLFTMTRTMIINCNVNVRR